LMSALIAGMRTPLLPLLMHGARARTAAEAMLL
jgi:hypothetical protein